VGDRCGRAVVCERRVVRHTGVRDLSAGPYLASRWQAGRDPIRGSWSRGLRRSAFTIGSRCNTRVGSEYLQEYWLNELPPASAGAVETARWLAVRVKPLAENPGGTGLIRLLVGQGMRARIVGFRLS
jgi:hypothetical protein